VNSFVTSITVINPRSGDMSHKV